MNPQRASIASMLLSLVTFAALAAVALCGCGDGNNGYFPEAPVSSAEAPMSHAVRVVWADGQTDYPGWCEGHVPTWFRCVNGQPCKPRILDAVRAWLAPFDVTVSDEQVVEAPLVTVLVSSGLAEECGRATGLRGQAMIGAPAAGSWINIWSAGNADAWDAQAIAHELGHAVGGLKHTHDGSLMDSAQGELEPVGYDAMMRPTEEGAMQSAYAGMLLTLGGVR